MTNASSNQIHPLNLNTSEYNQLYCSKPPTEVQIVLNICAIVPIPNADTELRLAYHQSNLHEIIGMYGILRAKHMDVLAPAKIMKSNMTVGIGITPKPLLELVTEEMLDCAVDGVYPNVAICKVPNDPSSWEDGKVAMAMRCLDHWISKSGSTDPASQSPLIVSEKCSKAYKANIGDTFTNGIGLWNEGLVHIRSAWQVILRAHMLDQDSEGALLDFLDSGQPNFHAYMKSLR